MLGLLRRRELRLLYVAPERLARPDTVEMLAERDVALDGDRRGALRLAMGPRFPARIPARWATSRARSAALQTLALTATADAPTRDDIVDKLFRAPPRVFVRSFDRPNLRLAFKPKERSARQVLGFVRDHEGESGIIYCASRRKVEELAAALTAAGVRALPYHAGLDKAVRDANQDAFQQEDGVVMTATVAFGMGIDKPDVRFVCHADLPANVEAYYQEIGRAGRDGLPADTLTLYSLGDMQLRRLQIEQGERPTSASASNASGSTRCWRWPRRRAAGARPCSPISARRRRRAATAISARRASSGSTARSMRRRRCRPSCAPASASAWSIWSPSCWASAPRTC